MIEIDAGVSERLESLLRRAIGLLEQDRQEARRCLSDAAVLLRLRVNNANPKESAANSDRDARPRQCPIASTIVTQAIPISFYFAYPEAICRPVTSVV